MARQINVSNGFKKLSALALVSSLLAPGVLAAPTGTIKHSTRYPWNGLVDITCTVSGVEEAQEKWVKITRIDKENSITNELRNVLYDNAPLGDGFMMIDNGTYHFVWDATADAGNVVLSNIAFQVSFKALPKYCVIDLAGGVEAEKYPVSYLSDVPAGGWSDEYKTTKLVLRKISAGTFMMGSPAEEFWRQDDEIQHSVTIAKDFWIGVFEVTQRQWELVTGERPSYCDNEECYAMRPVERVSYYMIRGELLGDKWPESDEVDPSSFFGILRRKVPALRLDLPTEEQWEYACRAMTRTMLNSGENIASEEDVHKLCALGRCEHNNGDSRLTTTEYGTEKVGSFKANAWGLYDMHGNVREWCLDKSKNSSASDTSRVTRGGGWNNEWHACRSAFGGFSFPERCDIACGLRLVVQPQR